MEVETNAGESQSVTGGTSKVESPEEISAEKTEAKSPEPVSEEKDLTIASNAEKPALNVDSTEESSVDVKEVAKSAPEETKVVTIDSSASLTTDYNQWLNERLHLSLDWLKNADRNNVSIQVMTRNKSSGNDLAKFLQNEWPLEVEKTYVYEVKTQNRTIYRVFYGEFQSVALGKIELEALPNSVKANSPYLHSVYRMQKALL